MKPLKRPISVLVILHDGQGHALLLERAPHSGLWQSVTGSLEADESPQHAALREVQEETGLILPPHALHDCHLTTEYDIYPQWQHRYPAGTTRNTEHTFRARIPADSPITLAENEHSQWQWLPLQEAAAKVFSPSNQAALLRLAAESPN